MFKIFRSKKDPYALKVKITEDKAAIKIQKAYRNHIGRRTAKHEQEETIKEYGCRTVDVTDRINTFIQHKEDIMNEINQIKQNINELDKDTIRHTNDIKVLLLNI